MSSDEDIVKALEATIKELNIGIEQRKILIRTNVDALSMETKCSNAYSNQLRNLKAKIRNGNEKVSRQQETTPQSRKSEDQRPSNQRQTQQQKNSYRTLSSQRQCRCSQNDMNFRGMTPEGNFARYDGSTSTNAQLESLWYTPSRPVDERDEYRPRRAQNAAENDERLERARHQNPLESGRRVYQD